MTNTPIIEPGTRIWMGVRYFIAHHKGKWGIWDSMRPASLEPVQTAQSLTAAKLAATSMEAGWGRHEKKGKGAE